MSKKPGDHDTIIHIAHRLRDLRIQRDVKQDVLAKAWGVSTQQVDRLEKGEQRISLAQLVQAKKLLRVEMSYFFEGLEDPDDKPDPVLTHRAIELARDYDAIQDPDTKNRVYQMLKTFPKKATKTG